MSALIFFLVSEILSEAQKISFRIGVPSILFFSKIPNFWAWTDQLVWNFLWHLWYFWPICQYPFLYCESRIFLYWGSSHRVSVVLSFGFPDKVIKGGVISEVIFKTAIFFLSIHSQIPSVKSWWTVIWFIYWRTGTQLKIPTFTLHQKKFYNTVLSLRFFTNNLGKKLTNSD